MLSFTDAHFTSFDAKIMLTPGGDSSGRGIEFFMKEGAVVAELVSDRVKGYTSGGVFVPFRAYLNAKKTGGVVYHPNDFIYFYFLLPGRF